MATNNQPALQPPELLPCEWCKQVPETGAIPGKAIARARCVNRSCPVVFAGWMAIEFWNGARVADVVARVDTVVADWFKTDFISALNPRLDRLVGRLKDAITAPIAAPVDDRNPDS